MSLIIINKLLQTHTVCTQYMYNVYFCQGHCYDQKVLSKMIGISILDPSFGNNLISTTTFENITCTNEH